MKSIASSFTFISLFVLASVCSAAGNFKEPKTEAEWKTFCEAPDYLEKIKEIKDKAQRERVSGTCLRAPWQKFAPSKPKQW